MRIEHISIALLSMVLLCGCSLSRVDVTKNIAQDSCANIIDNRELLERFYEYWTYISKGELEKSYNLEAPHFRYLNKFDIYSAYYRDTIFDRSSIVCTNFKQTTNNMYRIILNLNRTSTERGVFQEDLWLEVDGEYYHYIGDRLIFKH